MRASISVAHFLASTVNSVSYNLHFLQKKNHVSLRGLAATLRQSKVNSTEQKEANLIASYKLTTEALGLSKDAKTRC